jgi:hypothetical protein
MPPKAAAKPASKGGEKPAKGKEEGKKDSSVGKKGNDPKMDDAEKLKLLTDSGLLEAYECIECVLILDVIQSLYKAGMPEGNIFDFASSRIAKFEHKWNTEQRKKAYIDKYKLMGTGKDLQPSKFGADGRPTSAKSNKSAKSAVSGKKEGEKKEVGDCERIERRQGQEGREVPSEGEGEGQREVEVTSTEEEVKAEQRDASPDTCHMRIQCEWPRIGSIRFVTV